MRFAQGAGMDTVQVFDTWVEVPGKRLHFDVMTSDSSMALNLANEYVATLGHRAITVALEECRFCQQEPLLMFNEYQQQAFRQAGGFIVPLSA